MITSPNYLRYLIVIIGLIPMSNHADTYIPPLAKHGVCPSGYLSSGDYCVPRDDAAPAIEKRGVCPSGYLSSGNYCLARDQVPTTILKNGRYCPPGWLSNGDYCQQ